jgi:hypothetical protein
VRVAKPILTNGVLDKAAWVEKAGSFDLMGIQSRGDLVGVLMVRIRRFFRGDSYAEMFTEAMSRGIWVLEERDAVPNVLPQDGPVVLRARC